MPRGKPAFFPCGERCYVAGTHRGSVMWRKSK